MIFTTRFKEIKESKQFSFRNRVRDIALTGLSTQIRMSKSKSLFQKKRVQFIYIHHVFEDEIESFDKMINALSKDHYFISYSEAVNKILTNKIDKPYISISSDDGFKNNLNVSEILNKYDIKGCFFINPDTIDLKDYQKIKSFCKIYLKQPPIEFMNW